MRNIVPRFRTIQVKLVALFMVVALFSVLSTAITIIKYEKSNSREKELHRIDSIAEILAPTLTAAVVFRDDFAASELLMPLMSDNTIIDAKVYTLDSDVFVSFQSPHLNSIVPNTVYITVAKPLVHDETNYGNLVIRVNDQSINKHIKVYSLFVGLIAVITLAISFALAIVFSRYIIDPLLNLARVATKVTKTNNYALRAETTTKDEIGQLTQCFNLMLENVELRDRNLELQVKQRTTELEAANSKLQKQAYHDSLSDLPNRRYLNEELRNYLIKYEANESIGFSILFLDLDGFKDVNDTLGHDYGDLLLIAVADRLRSVVRASDLVVRLGGDEFTILLGDVIDREHSTFVAKNVQRELNQPFIIKDEEISVTVSIGVAIFPINAIDVETILKCADLAMYEAKYEGRNCYRYFDNMMMDRLIEKRSVVADLKVALREEQFELYFQPIVDFSTGEIAKVEALIRWNHPTKGLVFPDEFISIAEEFGIINEIGEWVLRNACLHIPILQKTFNQDIQISVNVSPAQFKGDFKRIETWLNECRKCERQVDLISFEITENLLMTSDEIVKDRLKLLKNVGIDIAIDDFGVGYSSLSYLQQIEIDFIKIDRSFVKNLVDDANSQALCKAMIQMADELGIKVVAEGIEEKRQSDLLASYGCGYAQGYYFSKPVPIDVLIDSTRVLVNA
ncbi:EAL domain-containing protein [Vibrio sp. DW001]|uniref:EAL domain-containing protein n=1 Tax=Vibrio sp. DW001 TaxID=2912315 RepID=UPI0023AFC2C1|nr:EAL domain-containing protein [Vibrio sp. DW001]WED29237.1 EAL domain-containing protein [Vibrio sp. DW001]